MGDAQRRGSAIAQSRADRGADAGLVFASAQNQLALAGPSIAVYNASDEADWDIVAAQRLRWEGYNGIALGQLAQGGSYPSSQLTDHVVTEKGSLTGRILRALNMTEEQVIRDARADRNYDYEVILGRDYESCTFGVLPLDS